MEWEACEKLVDGLTKAGHDEWKVTHPSVVMFGFGRISTTFFHLIGLRHYDRKHWRNDRSERSVR